MPRKNSRAAKPRMKRNRHAPALPAAPKRPPVPRPSIAEMVRPKGYCPSKKSRYASAADAAEALKQAQQGRLARGLKYVEKRFYVCDRCPDPETGDPGFHLTSRETYEKRPVP